MTQHYETHSEKETEALGREFAASLQGGETLLREIGRHGALPVSHSLRRLESLGGFCADSARTEAAAGELYAMSLPRPAPRGADYTARLYRAAQTR